MPQVYVTVDSRHGSGRKLLQLVFPRLVSPDAPEYRRWEWPELQVNVSDIQGFGLYTRGGGAVQWDSLQRQVVVPYLGKETEVESASQALVLRSVLSGNFDLVKQSELHTPKGYTWAQDGLYVVLLPTKEAKAHPEKYAPLPAGEDTELVQVSVCPDFDSRGIFCLDEREEAVCYMRSDEVAQLLHLPPHIFHLLAAHAIDEHADRNMTTHLVQFTRKVGIHLLVNAHPLFRNSAFIMGNANEPSKGAPTLELQEMQVSLLSDDDPMLLRSGLRQDPEACHLFRIFALEFPEVLEKSTFFCTKRDAYRIGEELTAVYGSSYKRTYSTWGHAGVPLRYRIPEDIFAPGVWRGEAGQPGWAEWPLRCPGWWNVDQQPTNRPALRRDKKDDSRVVLVADLQAVVSARKGALDGDSHQQRLAKYDSLFADWSLPNPEQESFALPMNFSMLVPAEEQKDFLLPRAWKWQDVVVAKLRQLGAAVADGECNALEFGDGEVGVDRTDGEMQLDGRFVREFALPSDLRGVRGAELRARAAYEEKQERRASAMFKIHDTEEEDPDWLSPWSHPLGSIVWCKGVGFSWWPAQVVKPAVEDRDIARLREDGQVFVRYFGWSKKSCYGWVERGLCISWLEGVQAGHDKTVSLARRKAKAKSLVTAKAEAEAAYRALPMAPKPPPPWWQSMSVPGGRDGDMSGPDTEQQHRRTLRSGSEWQSPQQLAEAAGVPSAEAEQAVCDAMAAGAQGHTISAGALRWREWLDSHAAWATSQMTIAQPEGMKAAAPRRRTKSPRKSKKTVSQSSAEPTARSEQAGCRLGRPRRTEELRPAEAAPSDDSCLAPDDSRVISADCAAAPTAPPETRRARGTLRLLRSTRGKPGDLAAGESASIETRTRRFVGKDAARKEGANSVAVASLDCPRSEPPVKSILAGGCQGLKGDRKRSPDKRAQIAALDKAEGGQSRLGFRSVKQARVR